LLKKINNNEFNIHVGKKQERKIKREKQNEEMKGAAVVLDCGGAHLRFGFASDEQPARYQSGDVFHQI
jgi:hypothetical protein